MKPLDISRPTSRHETVAKNVLMKLRQITTTTREITISKFMNNKFTDSSFMQITTDDGLIIITYEEKIELFAIAFSAKSTLIPIYI